MTYQPYPVQQFSGLNLIDDPQEVGAGSAVDLLNVDFNKPGRVRARDGWSLITSSGLASDIQAMGFYSTSAGTEHLVISDATTLRPYLADGTAGTTQAGAAASNNSFARFGDPTNTRLYVGAGGNYYRFNGAAWTLVAVTPDPDLLAVTANDNRMAVAGSTLDAKVWFSDAGDPETFGANNYVGLWPGDGERITGLIRWRDRLFAFKKTKYAVFSGTSTAGDGNPVFNYFGVDAGMGAVQPGAAVAGDDGVYFADLRGVYRTTGGEATYVSRAIEPWYRQEIAGPVPVGGLPTLTYLDRRLYVNWVSLGAQAVLDTTTGNWSAWDLNATALLGVKGYTSFGSGVYLGDSVSRKVGLVSPQSSADNATAIPWRYQSGFYEIGSPGAKAYTRWTRLWGMGNATVSVFTDHGTSDANAAALSMGSGTPAEAYHKVAYRGEFFSHKLSGTAAGVSINRLQHDIAWVKP